VICPNCDETKDFTWAYVLGPSYETTDFYLGCNTCSETLSVAEMDEVAACLNAMEWRYGMPAKLMFCNECTGEKFNVAYDEIGIALMQAHLRDEHGIVVKLPELGMRSYTDLQRPVENVRTDRL
jgi:hypothetical protein